MAHDADIGTLTYDFRSRAKEIVDAWTENCRRDDFGARELLDIRETVLGLSVLLREIDKLNARAA